MCNLHPILCKILKIKNLQTHQLRSTIGVSSVRVDQVSHSKGIRKARDWNKNGLIFLHIKFLGGVIKFYWYLRIIEQPNKDQRFV